MPGSDLLIGDVSTNAATAVHSPGVLKDGVDR
jgi:hypothetical protein